MRGLVCFVWAGLAACGGEVVVTPSGGGEGGNAVIEPVGGAAGAAGGGAGSSSGGEGGTGGSVVEPVPCCGAELGCCDAQANQCIPVDAQHVELCGLPSGFCGSCKTAATPYGACVEGHCEASP